MEVIRAKTAGFCFGVKRAVDTVYEQLEKASESTTIYTYGPIIHNEEVVKDMKQKGVIVLQSEAELDALTEGTVIIRSHGVKKAIYDKLNAKGIKIVDATCPFVKKIDQKCLLKRNNFLIHIRCCTDIIFINFLIYTELFHSGFNHIVPFSQNLQM